MTVEGLTIKVFILAGWEVEQKPSSRKQTVTYTVYQH